MARERPFWSKTGALTTTPSGILLPNGWSQLKITVDARCYGAVGSSPAAPAVATVNAVTTISESAGTTGGTFVIRVFPDIPTLNQTLNEIAAPVYLQTGDIPYNETAANIKADLLAAPTTPFASADLTAAGGALPADVSLTWTGEYAGVHPRIDIDGAKLTGPNPKVWARVTTQPLGNGGYGYLEANLLEFFHADPTGNNSDRFLYLAAVATTANYFVTAQR